MVRHATANIFRQLLLYVVMFLSTIIYFFSVNALFTLCLVAVTPFLFFVPYPSGKQTGYRCVDPHRLSLIHI